MANKIRVVVLYGGRSGEHEVSLRSAASVLRHLDRARFEVIPVSIDKTGRWQWNDLGTIDQAGAAALPILPGAPEMRLARGPDGRGALMPISESAAEPLRCSDQAWQSRCCSRSRRCRCFLHTGVRQCGPSGFDRNHAAEKFGLAIVPRNQHCSGFWPADDDSGVS